MKKMLSITLVFILLSFTSVFAQSLNISAEPNPFEIGNSTKITLKAPTNVMHAIIEIYNESDMKAMPKFGVPQQMLAKEARQNFTLHGVVQTLLGNNFHQVLTKFMERSIVSAASLHSAMKLMLQKQTTTLSLLSPPQLQPLLPVQPQALLPLHYQPNHPSHPLKNLLAPAQKLHLHQLHHITVVHQMPTVLAVMAAIMEFAYIQSSQLMEAQINSWRLGIRPLKLPSFGP